ncbi:MAG: hypothetical protein JWO69_154 [Thermoleophilia bacterium]|nr:hypothetical protein [Thermoleophilia bacterium]
MHLSLRLPLIVLSIAFASLVAAGCGDDGGSEGDGVTASDGPLAYLPADTWLVATGQADPEQLDTAVKTLERLPIWALAEGFLPASDGKGLRAALLSEVAGDFPKNAKITGKRLETAFGHGAGMAITSTDFSGFDDEGGGRTAPVVFWIDVDDEEAVDGVFGDLVEGEAKESEHAGETYRSGALEEGDFAWLHIDEQVLFTPNVKLLEQLIDVRDDEEGIAEDDDARRVLEAGVADAMTGAAIQTGPLLKAAPRLVREAGGANEEQAKQLEELLSSAAVSDFVPNWVSGSATVDDTGLRMRGAWSNPNNLAKPEVGSRELGERMPADAGMVSAGVVGGTELGRVQDAWRKVADTYDLELEQLASDCPPAYTVFCDLGVEAAKVVLEDDELAKAVADAGPMSYAYTHDISALAAGAAPGRGAAAAPATRSFEMVTSGADEPIDYEAPRELIDAAAAAGITMTVSDDQRTVNMKVARRSPLGALITREAATPEARQALASLGIDVRQLFGPGITIKAEEVDGLLITGFPTNAPSKVAPALRGDVDTLGDDDDYRATVDAAKPPKEVGAYGYVDLAGIVESLLNTIAASSPDSQDVSRVIPTVRNNLADVPGILTWTAREEIDGEDVGVYELVLVIEE